MKKNKILILVVFSMAVTAAGPGWGQDQKQKLAPQYRRPEIEITAVPVAGGLYELRGGVSNAAFYVGKKSVYIFDTKMTPEEAGKMLSVISEVTSKPLSHIILTHSDGDHVGGLTGFPKGLAVIAHEATTLHMKAAFTSDGQKEFLPDISFSDGMSIQTGLGDIILKYFGRAHTDGDAIAFFPKEKAVICGDLIFVGRDPLIHRHKNGSAKGLIEVLKNIMSLDADTYLSGHADPIGKAELKNIILRLEEAKVKVEKLFAEGKSLEEVKKAMGIEESEGQRRWPSYAENLFQEMAEKK
jgi:cyclase